VDPEGVQQSDEIAKSIRPVIVVRTDGETKKEIATLSNGIRRATTRQGKNIRLLHRQTVCTNGRSDMKRGKHYPVAELGNPPEGSDDEP